MTLKFHSRVAGCELMPTYVLGSVLVHLYLLCYLIQTVSSSLLLKKGEKKWKCSQTCLVRSLLSMKALPSNKMSLKVKNLKGKAEISSSIAF